MYLHLFASETTYSSTLLDLLARNLDMQEHYFVFGLGKSHPIKREYHPQLNHKIYFLKNLKDIFKILRLIKKAQWIYFHFLAYDPTLFYWWLMKKKLKRSTWIIWGADVYAYKKAGLNFKTAWYEKARQHIIPQFPEIAAFVKADYEIVRSLYHTNSEYQPILYPIPVNIGHLKQFNVQRAVGSIKIMIGNSGDPSNEHIDALKKISIFSDRDIQVICPLSYGGTPEYLNRVITEGKLIFGEKFNAITEMMETNDYARFLSDIDIVIMNHERQQGLGNIMALLYLEKKVFLKVGTTSYEFLIENGCKIESVDKLGQIDYNEFINFTDELKKNRIVMQEMLSDEFPLTRWKKLLNRH